VDSTLEDPAAADLICTIRTRCSTAWSRCADCTARQLACGAVRPAAAGRPLTVSLAERAAARAGMATRLQRVALDRIDVASAAGHPGAQWQLRLRAARLEPPTVTPACCCPRPARAR
jgi:hypothetical protein